MHGLGTSTVSSVEGNAKTVKMSCSRSAENIFCIVPRGIQAPMVHPKIMPYKPAFIIYIVNIFHFKAQWADTFFSNDTYDNTFYRSESDSTTAKFMSQKGAYNYDSTVDYQAIELPYKGNETSMLIVLPAPGKMAQIEAGLSADFLTAIVASMQPTNLYMEGLSAIETPRLPTFNANRPNIFFIRDIQTNTILFMGKLCNPIME